MLKLRDRRERREPRHHLNAMVTKQTEFGVPAQLRDAPMGRRIVPAQVAARTSRIGQPEDRDAAVERQHGVGSLHRSVVAGALRPQAKVHSAAIRGVSSAESPRLSPRRWAYPGLATRPLTAEERHSDCASGTSLCPPASPQLSSDLLSRG